MADIFDPAFDENVSVEVSDNRISKGEDINLTAKDPTMTNILIGLGWSLSSFDTDALDLDVSCFLLNKDHKTRVDEDFIFYNNLEGCDGAVVHNSDQRSGAGEGDDESISIDLNAIPFDVVKVMFVISIYQGEEKEQSLSSLRNPYLRVVNTSNSHELLRYELTDDVKDSKETAMHVASLNREGPKWHFEAIGKTAKDLAVIATDYDLIVQAG